MGKQSCATPWSLYRRVPCRRSAGLIAGALIAVVLGTWAFATFIYPSEIVREALVHEQREATLRGDFQPDEKPMLAAMGLHDPASLPGLMQLQRPCEIGGRVAYHVTTFFEQGGGMVTILAFEKPLRELRGGQHGSWLGRHWRVADGLPGRTVLLLADNAAVLTRTERILRSG